MKYNEHKSELLSAIHKLQSEMDKYRLKQDANSYYISRQISLIQKATDFITSADDLISKTKSPNQELITIIKKQALIIDAAKITFPTINQSLELIHDYYLQSIGNTEKIGQQNPEISVEIKII